MGGKGPKQGSNGLGEKLPATHEAAQPAQQQAWIENIGWEGYRGRKRQARKECEAFAKQYAPPQEVIWGNWANGKVPRAPNKTKKEFRKKLGRRLKDSGPTPEERGERGPGTKGAKAKGKITKKNGAERKRGN